MKGNEINYSNKHRFHKDIQLSMSFLVLADIGINDLELVKNTGKEKKLDGSNIVIPIMFCLTHAFEMSMKGIIKTICDLDDTLDVSSKTYNHDLIKLYNLALTYVKMIKCKNEIMCEKIFSHFYQLCFPLERIYSITGMKPLPSVAIRFGTGGMEFFNEKAEKIFDLSELRNMSKIMYNNLLQMMLLIYEEKGKIIVKRTEKIAVEGGHIAFEFIKNVDKNKKVE